MTSRDLGEGIIATWNKGTLVLSLTSNPEIFLSLSPYVQSALNAFTIECLKAQIANTRPAHESPQQFDASI